MIHFTFLSRSGGAPVLDTFLTRDDALRWWTRSSRERPRRRGRSLLALDRRAAARFAALDASKLFDRAGDAGGLGRGGLGRGRTTGSSRESTTYDGEKVLFGGLEAFFASVLGL